MKNPISVPEAARILGVTEACVLKRLQRGELFGIPFSGKAWMVCHESVLGQDFSKAKFRTMCSRWVPVPVACNIVGVTDAGVVRMVRRGQLKGFRLNRVSWAVDRKSCEDNIADYLANLGKRPGQPRRLGEERNGTVLKKRRQSGKTQQKGR